MKGKTPDNLGGCQEINHENRQCNIWLFVFIRFGLMEMLLSLQLIDTPQRQP